MTLDIRLLGAPRIERAGQPVQAPRGNKAWGLLAYLVLATTPVTRRQLCSLLFADAADPLAALRWNLSELRRALGEPDVFRGDPIGPGVGSDARVDVSAVTAGPVAGSGWVENLGDDLLESMAFAACPSFEVWLDAERRHLRGAAEGVLHETALTRLAAGDGHEAADAAGRLVRMNPYDENYQALLVRSLAAAGDGVGAAKQVAACRELFRRELGVEPGRALEAAAAALTATPIAPASTGRAGVVAQLEAGQAAIRAGAVEAGVQSLRRAVTDSGRLHDPALEAEALVALGSALVHAVRGADEEGTTALHQALAVAADSRPGGAGGTSPAATASRELGYVEFLRGRYDRVEPWLTRAEETVGPDANERAAILSVRGSTLTDTASYPPAVHALQTSIEVTSDDRQRAYALSMLGRAHLLCGAFDAAATALDQSARLARERGWTAFLPWPESMRASIDLERGEHDVASDRLEHAFALSCQVGDPCWEGISGRGLGLLQAAHGDVSAAVATLLDARARSTRLPDAYLWVDAYTLDALCTIAVEHRLPRAAEWIAALGDLAGRTGMRELFVRSLVHGAAMGATAGLDVARSLAVAIDNPRLTAEVERSLTADV